MCEDTDTGAPQIEASCNVGFEFHGNTVKSNPNSNNSSLWLILCEFDVKTMTRVLCVCFMYSHPRNQQASVCIVYHLSIELLSFQT